MAIDFPDSPTDGEVFKPVSSPFTYVYNASVNAWVIPVDTDAIINGSNGQCRLSVASTTTIRLDPFNGSQIRLNGSVRRIPEAGITVDNSGVLAETVRFVYLFDNGTDLALEISASGHATDLVTTGNIGVEIKGGPDPTRTLVGMVRTDVSGEFGTFSDVKAADLINWFNRALDTRTSGFGGDVPNFEEVTMSRIHPTAKLGICTWGASAPGDAVHFWTEGSNILIEINANLSNYLTVGIQEIGTGVNLASLIHTAAGIGSQTHSSLSVDDDPAEGYHEYAIFGAVAGTSGGTAPPEYTFHGADKVSGAVTTFPTNIPQSANRLGISRFG